MQARRQAGKQGGAGKEVTTEAQRPQREGTGDWGLGTGGRTNQNAEAQRSAKVAANTGVKSCLVYRASGPMSSPSGSHAFFL